MKRIMTVLQALFLAAVDYVDRVPQNPNAVVMGKYKGALVRLAPVMAADGHIEAWVPDREEAEQVDKHLAKSQSTQQTGSADATAPSLDLNGIEGL